MRRFAMGLVCAAACGGSNGSDTTSAWQPGDESTGAPSESSSGAQPQSEGDSESAGESDPRPTTTTTSAAESSGDASSSEGPMCLPATEPCTDTAQCCGALECGTTSLGQVCCGQTGESCATANGEDCCGDLLCIDGACGYDLENVCEAPCTEAPALVIEKNRLIDTIGGSWLGICGDVNHTYGYHVPAANLPSDDYSLEGAANAPVCDYHAAAIDIGMDWPASREWLMWLIPAIANDDITGIAEVIGSYDGVNVRYWSDGTGWSVDGIEYTGEGHDTWTHVAIYRSTALEDHGILAGWTADGGP
ncbi:MAG TPA: hypothetical protein VG755_32970 [Nannocystaceae bacterium]|nr:hypothetical protein [Nannocystaceae bacterium]